MIMASRSARPGSVNGSRGVNLVKVTLRSMLKHRSCINFGHLNACSIKPKIDELRNIFEDSFLDVIVVPESWCKSYVSDKSIDVTGYNVLRNDRKAKRGGGVVVYVRGGLRTKVVSLSDNIATEYIFFELIFPHTKVLVGAFYKAPKVDDIEKLDEILDILLPQYEAAVLLGDFNENMLTNATDQCLECRRGGCKACQFRAVLEKFSLHMLGAEPTHFQPGCTPTQIDLIVTNDLARVRFYNQLSSGLSHHDLLVASFDFDYSLESEQKRYHRRFKSVNYDRLAQDSQSLPWQQIYRMTNVDDMVNHVNGLIHTLLERHAPLVPVVNISLTSTKPWFTRDIRIALIEKNLAFHYWKVNRDQVHRDKYTKFRNKVTQMIKAAKRRYFKRLLAPSLGSKTLWSNLRGIGLVKSQSQVLPTCTADDYNVYLATSVTGLRRRADIRPQRGHTSPQVTSAIRSDQRFSFVTVPEYIVAQSILRIASKASGTDGTPPMFVKILLPTILPYVTHVFNQVLTRSYYPRPWKSAKLLPTHKKTRSFEPKDFRPISLLPFLSKALESIMKDQISDFISRHGLLSRFQSSYRRGYSTASALAFITDEILPAMDKRKVMFLLLLDFTKAFDTVSHSLLCNKLMRRFNFDDTAVKLVESYLTDRVQAVQIDGVLSAFLPVEIGLPQGSSLSPLLFTMFINDITAVLKHTRPHLYADDVQVFKESSADIISLRNTGLVATQRPSSELSEDTGHHFWSHRRIIFGC